MKLAIALLVAVIGFLVFAVAVLVLLGRNGVGSR
jgi:hypothetical protein